MTLRNILESIIEYSGFKHHCLFNTDKVLTFINEIKVNPNCKVLLDLDYDPDGILAGIIFYNTLKDIGVTNVDVHIPEGKRHGVDEATINKLSDGYTHLIILDSSTNSMGEIKMINDMGVKVLVVDHHMPEFKLTDYPAGTVLINNKINLHDSIVREASSGFLSYLLTTDIRKHYGFDRDKSHFIYGYITLISDVCDLSDDYLKPVILDIGKYSPYTPTPVRLFMGNYDELNRKFVSFRFVNKINSLCRSDRGDLLRKLFFELNHLDSTEINALVAEINDVHKTISDKVRQYSECLYDFVEHIGSFVLVDMSRALSRTSLTKEYLINSTGQFANNISRHFNKPAICIMPMSNNAYKCSARDCTGLLDLFEIGQRFNLGGGGHRGAYGCELSKYDLDEFKMLIGTIEIETNSEVAIDCDSLSYVEFKSLLNNVAMFNEVSGNKLSKLKLKRTLNSSFIVRDIGKLRLFSMRDIELKDFKQQRLIGDTVLLEPVYAKKPYCIVE